MVHVSCGCIQNIILLLLVFRIQNMKIIDGVPEYKNGFVSIRAVVTTKE